MKSENYFLPTGDLKSLLNCLQREGYQCVGPQVRDGAIVFDEIQTVEQLPRNISDKQTAGSYTLNNTTSGKYFDWANGPQAIKPLLFAPREALWQSEQAPDGEIQFTTVTPAIKPLAIIGVRSCDIAAMKIHDQHFLQQQYVDPCYKARREALLIITVNCGHPAETCFCHSTGDGPFADTGVTDNGSDIVLTELDAGFIIEAQTTAGKHIIDGLTLKKCTEAQLAESAKIATTAAKQKKQLPKFDIKSRLYEQLNSEAWHDIASECLSCGNCTSVCPTCFCHSENDVPVLDGTSSTHVREWDSCFTQGHSYIHGMTIRSQTSQRYRQWLTHKFSTWHDQYGRSGCVGCGRCITWCPVAIDVTESITRVCSTSESD